MHCLRRATQGRGKGLFAQWQQGSCPAVLQRAGNAAPAACSAQDPSWPLSQHPDPDPNTRTRTCRAVSQLAAAPISPGKGLAAGGNGGRVRLARCQRSEAQAGKRLHLARLQQQRQVAGHATLSFRVSTPAGRGGSSLGECGGGSGRQWRRRASLPARGLPQHLPWHSPCHYGEPAASFGP